MSQYLYQNTGGSPWSWKHGPPSWPRAATTRDLGRVGGMGNAVFPGGIPEPLGGLETGVKSLVMIGVLGAAAWVVLSVLGRRAHAKAYKSNPSRRRRKRRGRRARFRRRRR